MCYDRFLTLADVLSPLTLLLFLDAESDCWRTEDEGCLAGVCRNLCLIGFAASGLYEIPRAFNSRFKRCGLSLVGVWRVCNDAVSDRSCQSGIWSLHLISGGGAAAGMSLCRLGRALRVRRGVACFSRVAHAECAEFLEYWSPRVRARARAEVVGQTK